jgi:phosphopantothenoylcysteine decarboxylase/phosphopantothenate--cysteine ligase
VTIVSGPVTVEYPSAAEVVSVVSTEEMLAACRKVFVSCDGMIAAAAPCDYRPAEVAAHKIRKTGQPLRLELVETADIVATLAGEKGGRWIVAFALESEDARARALRKLERKNCDLIVVNGPEVLDAACAEVEVLDRDGQTVGRFCGSKSDIARDLLGVIRRRLIEPTQETRAFPPADAGR